jgi:hypothetical protein
MSQLIACKNKNGIVLAADSKALDIDASGTVTEHTVSRLIQLADHSLILAGGASAGVTMARALKGFLSGEKWDGVEAVYDAALPFLASQYTEFMRKSCEVQPLDPMHHVHFIIAGRSSADAPDPFKLYFLWTKKKLPQLAGEAIGNAFSVPRLIRLEYRLSQMAADGADLDSLQKAALQGIQERIDTDDEAGGPVAHAAITTAGVQLFET